MDEHELLRIALAGAGDIEEWRLGDPKVAATHGYPRRFEVPVIDDFGTVFVDVTRLAGSGEIVCHEVNGPNGVVARGAARLTLIADGLDPRGLLAPELGHLEREPEYLGSSNAFATGTPDGVRSWLRHCATAAEIAAARLSSLADAV